MLDVQDLGITTVKCVDFLFLPLFKIYLDLLSVNNLWIEFTYNTAVLGTFSDMTHLYCSIVFFPFSHLLRLHCRVFVAALCKIGSQFFFPQFVKFALLLVEFSLPVRWWFWQLVLTAQLLPISFKQTAVVAGGNATIHLCARGYFPGKTYQTHRASHHLSLIWCTLLNRLFGTADICLVFNTRRCYWHMLPWWLSPKTTQVGGKYIFFVREFILTCLSLVKYHIFSL